MIKDERLQEVADFLGEQKDKLLRLIEPPFQAGQKVRTGVWVGCDWHEGSPGIVVAVHDGYCDVDIMGLHGGAPWIVQYTNTSMEAF
jgi:hypothetical protein